MFTRILVTANSYDDHETLPGGIIDITKKKGTLKEYQTVVAVGSSVSSIKPGDIVLIDPSRYAIRKQKQTAKDDMAEYYTNTTIGYDFNVVELQSGKCIMLDQQDIVFVVEDYIPDKKGTRKK